MSFGLVSGEAMQMTLVDVCKTVVGPAVVPMPYPNVSRSASAMWVVGHVLFECLCGMNKHSKDTCSTGNEASVSGGGGAVSGVCGPTGGRTGYGVGCSTIFIGGAPLQRLFSVTEQNAMGETPNALGMSCTPSQTTVLALG